VTTAAVLRELRNIAKWKFKEADFEANVLLNISETFAISVANFFKFPQEAERLYFEISAALGIFVRLRFFFLLFLLGQFLSQTSELIDITDLDFTVRIYDQVLALEPFTHQLFNQ